MNKFAIITDSSSDLVKSFRDEFDIECIPIRFFHNDKEYAADPDWTAMPVKEFYDIVRSGVRIRTSQISTVACKETFEKYLKEGYDILSISCTGALSSTVNVCYRTRDELSPLYPERKIICIDSCISSAGLGILCLKASLLRKEGKSIEEVAEWVENNKKFIHQEGSVDKLSYLKAAGRISAASAFFGGLLSIKPMIISDVHGYNVAIEKVKGRKNSIIRTAERVAQNYTGEGYPDIFIHNTDCYEDALLVKQEILARVNVKEEQIHIGNINAAIGASVGPGMFGVYFYGKEVTFDSKAK
ncbi:MAG: DegV family protein [Clostridiales bacterium]|nr:DegV family protein [Clostridiales bacterium]